MVVVDIDGSPSGERSIALWNPPLKTIGKAESLKREQDRNDSFFEPIPSDTAGDSDTVPMRLSPMSETGMLLAFCAMQKLQSLCFCPSRKVAELVLCRAHDYLKSWKAEKEIIKKVVCYRGGYTVESRRDLERKLFTGEIMGASCTNALELGIDIGTLDVVINLGYPGSIASLYQRFGRAGRGSRKAIGVYVLFDSLIDQHFAANPTELFTRNVEPAVFDAGNPYVLKRHILCAAKEAPPLTLADCTIFCPKSMEHFARLVEELEKSGDLIKASDSESSDGGHCGDESWAPQ
eukprot:Selendium_serpulae@DN11169_c0_g1_i1.p2